MTVDAAMRLRIHRKLEELMGTEEADALVTNWLPWQEPATKDDIRALKDDVRALKDDLRVQSAELRLEMERLRTDVHGMVITQTRWILGYVTALAVALVTVNQLLA